MINTTRTINLFEYFSFPANYLDISICHLCRSCRFTACLSHLKENNFSSSKNKQHEDLYNKFASFSHISFGFSVCISLYNIRAFSHITRNVHFWWSNEKHNFRLDIFDSLISGYWSIFSVHSYWHMSRGVGRPVFFLSVIVHPSCIQFIVS